MLCKRLLLAPFDVDVRFVEPVPSLLVLCEDRRYEPLVAVPTRLDPTEYAELSFLFCDCFFFRECLWLEGVVYTFWAAE